MQVGDKALQEADKVDDSITFEVIDKLRSSDRVTIHEDNAQGYEPEPIGRGSAIGMGIQHDLDAL